MQEKALDAGKKVARTVMSGLAAGEASDDAEAVAMRQARAPNIFILKERVGLRRWLSRVQNSARSLVQKAPSLDPG